MSRMTNSQKARSVFIGLSIVLASAGTALAQGTISTKLGSGERFFDRPTAPQAFTQNGASKAQFGLPCLDGLHLTVVGQKTIVPLVATLLKTSGPPTVTRLVMTVGVDSVESHAVRTRSHIAQERIKAFRPRWAHRDSAQSVVLRACTIGRKNATTSVDPCSMLSRSTVSVFQVSCSSHFTVATPATRAESFADGVAVNTLYRSTFTPTHPPARRVINDGPAAEGATNHA